MKFEHLVSSEYFYYTPPSAWSGRADTTRERLFQQVQPLDLKELPATLPDRSIVLLGFACDAGVRRNEGRPGAAQAPEHLRRALANIPLVLPEGISLWDAGTLFCSGEDLEEAQSSLSAAVAALRQRGVTVLVLGGGHEVAWGNFQGLAASCDDGNGIDVLNFDAHFDLRPPTLEGLGTSGTSFRQMHDYCEDEKIPWRYAVLGIQPFGNTAALFEYAASIKASHFLAEELINHPERVHEALGVWLASAKKIHLTLCMDVFGAAFAPGVSAPQAMGLPPQTLLPFFRQVLGSGKVIGFDIAELNPLYDQDHQTASLAAYFVAEVLKNYVG